MWSAFFNFIIGFLATVVQIITFPLNAGFTAVLPDFSSQLVQFSENITTLFNSAFYPLYLLPNSLRLTLLFCVGIMIALITFAQLMYVVPLIWRIIKAIKFW